LFHDDLILKYINFFIGCSSVVDTSIFFLSTWDGIRHSVSDILWTYWKLDCLSN